MFADDTAILIRYSDYNAMTQRLQMTVDKVTT